MNDIEFAHSVSPRLGAVYEQAKELAPTTPGHALTFLRSFAAIFCETLDPSTKGEPNLNRKIATVLTGGLTSEKVLAQLRTLQNSGNKAAHPEEYDWTTLDFPAMVEDALPAARYLLEHLHWLSQGPAMPEYTVSKPSLHNQRELSFRAIFEENPDAQYTLGVHFKEKADHLNASDCIFRVDDGYGFTSRSAIDQAIHWLKLAAVSSHIEAMYEYGAYLARLQGDAFEDKRREGEHYVWQASERNHAEALAVMGDYYFWGSARYEQDLEYARELYQQAAVHSHPRALAQLGRMHERGLGGRVDFHAAFQCSLQSAEAGFPQAQFHLYTLHLQGHAFAGDSSAAVNWLIEAAEQKHPEAMLELAGLITQKRIPDRTVIDAQALYEQCIGTHHTRIKALYALANLLAIRSEELDALNHALSYVYNCKDEIVNRSEHHDLLTGCERLTAFILKKINTLMARDYPQFSFRVAVPPTITHQPAYIGPTVGRNEPCPCGSEKKYKHCCR